MVVFAAGKDGQVRRVSLLFIIRVRVRRQNLGFLPV